MSICSYTEKLPIAEEREIGIKNIPKFIYELTISNFKELASISCTDERCEGDLKLFKHSSKNIVVLLRTKGLYATGYIFIVRKTNHKSENALNWCVYNNIVYHKAYNGFVRDIVLCEELYEHLENWEGVITRKEFEIVMSLGLNSLPDIIYRQYMNDDSTNKTLINGRTLVKLRQLEVALLLSSMNEYTLSGFMDRDSVNRVVSLVGGYEDCLQKKLKEGYNIMEVK